MPIELPALTRRRMLHSGLLAGGALLAGCASSVRRPEQSRGARVVLLSDTHINADVAATNRDGSVNMAERLAAVIADLDISRRHPPRGGEHPPMFAMLPTYFLLINGDAAHIDGRPGDYELLVGMLGIIRAVEVPIHITLGNHDHRENFLDILPQQDPPVPHKHVLRRRDPANLDWYLLDSLDIVDATPGSLGDMQLAWLDRELAQHADHAAVLVMHHPPLPPQAGEKPWALLDDEALFEVLAKHRNVRAILCGHAHRWGRVERDGLPIIGLPPTSYVFREQDPWGYVVATHDGHMLTLTLRAMDGHAADGEAFTLALE